MCDYSLQSVKSRPAAVGDKLVTYHFGTGTRGFADLEANRPLGNATAVCVLPGTELAFAEDLKVINGYAYSGKAQEFKTAIFRQVNKKDPRRHHDALELPCGTIVMLTDLVENQIATVLQLPKLETKTQIEQAKRVEYV